MPIEPLQIVALASHDILVPCVTGNLPSQHRLARPLLMIPTHYNTHLWGSETLVLCEDSEFK